VGARTRPRSRSSDRRLRRIPPGDPRRGRRAQARRRVPRRPPQLRRGQGHQRRRLHRRRAGAVRDHRPERGGEDLDLQRPVGRLPAAGGRGALPRRGHPRPVAACHRRDGDVAHVPEHRAVREPHRPRQPHARAAPPRDLRLAVGAALRREGAEGGDRPPRRGRGHHRLPRDPGVPEVPRRPPPLRRPEARRARPRARHGAAPAAPRRAGRRHERRGDRGHGALHPRHPRRAEDPHDPGGARHGARHGPRGPRDGRRLRDAARDGEARRGPAQPRGHQGLPRAGPRRPPSSPPPRRPGPRRSRRGSATGPSAPPSRSPCARRTTASGRR
jgi:hypothetical protein